MIAYVERIVIITFTFRCDRCKKGVVLNKEGVVEDATEDPRVSLVLDNGRVKDRSWRLCYSCADDLVDWVQEV